MSVPPNAASEARNATIWSEAAAALAAVGLDNPAVSGTIVTADGAQSIARR
jgi:hypothetical protein